MSSKNIQFRDSKIIVTYDLSDNDISAQEIAKASNGTFYANIYIEGNDTYKLPNTTLISYKNISAESAVMKFKESFNNAKKRKFLSFSRISRIFAFEINGEKGYIEEH